MVETHKEIMSHKLKFIVYILAPFLKKKLKAKLKTLFGILNH
jgi:hypothetical protein